MTLKLSGARLAKDEVVILTPRLVGETDSIDFPEVVVFGRNTYYHDVRQRTITADISPDAYRIRYKEGKEGWPRNTEYARTVRYQPWMEYSQLKLITAQGAACDVQEMDVNLAGKWGIAPHDSTSAQATTTVRTELIDTVGSDARIQFIVDRTEFVPELAANRAELAKIRASIDSVMQNPDYVIKKLKIKGFASPEGPYDNNYRLATGRTERIRQFIVEQWGFPNEKVETDFQVEDWDGFRKYMVEHHDEFPDADAILRLIDKHDSDLDHKLWVIQLLHPKSYKRILKDCFPPLRHTEYVIYYERKRTIEEQVAVEPDTTETVHFIEEKPLRDNIVTTYKPLLPWVAVKTNMLFDLAVCPNIELEFPLGLDSRWSLMIEYWNPWYVWHHNSRAYEIQLLGFEARYWPSPRCAIARPTLTGTFFGLYYANGKYDMEWKSTGDQGEFNSFGLTYGYSWPLARSWNLEASASVGYFWGPRRHYNGEFNDTHLIWEYTGRTSYFGPTKLKLSLVWLIGR